MSYFRGGAIKLLLALLCFCLLESEGSNPTQQPEEVTKTVPPAITSSQTPSARQAWINMDKHLKTSMGKAIKTYLPKMMKLVYRKEISSRCLGALLSVSGALKQGKLWPFKMLDASGKFPEGFLSGTLTALGNYEECVNIDLNTPKLTMRGQYCLLTMDPPIPDWRPYTSLHLTVPELVNVSAPDTLITYMANFIHNTHVTTVKTGLCVPHRCTLDDVNRLAQIIPEMLDLQWKFEVQSCEVRSITEFSTAQVISLCLIVIMCFMVVVGTIVDQIWSSEEMERRGTRGAVFHYARCFSFPLNAKKISDWSGPSEDLGFIYGIIFFAFLWIVIANTFMYVNYDIASNFIEALSLVKNLFYEVMLNRIFPLQALLYLSGFTTAYRCLKSPDVGLNVPKFILKRYLRYTPTYALVIALVILLPLWGSGPTWLKSMSPYHDSCKNNWWYNILFINNFGDTNSMCLDHTWLLAVDAQLYLVAIVVLIPLKIRPAIGLMVNLVLSLASLISVALTNVYYDLPPNEMSAFLHPKDRHVYAELSYYRVYTHISVYCTGIFVAHLMVKRPDLKISRKMTWLLWTATGAGYLGALCVVHEWRNGYMPLPLTGAIYSTFSKVAECCFLAWLTVACMTGHGGGVRNVLSWRPFAFFARLTFIAYLIHVPLITLINAFKKAHVFLLQFEIFFLVLSYAAATYICSYIVHLFLEAPFLSLCDGVRRRCRATTLNRTTHNGTAAPITEKPEKCVRKASGTSWTPTTDRSNC